MCNVYKGVVSAGFFSEGVGELFLGKIFFFLKPKGFVSLEGCVINQDINDNPICKQNV